MAIVNNFLCFDLELGGYVIGIFGLVLSSLFIGFGGYRVLTLNDMSKKRIPIRCVHTSNAKGFSYEIISDDSIFL